MKWELSKKAKLSLFRTVFIPILIKWSWLSLGNDRKNSIASASVRNEIFAKNWRSYVILYYKMRSSEVWKSLNISRYFSELKGLSLMVCSCKQNALGKASQKSFTCESKRPVAWPHTRWEDYTEDLGWKRLELQPSEMLEVVADLDEWRLNLELLPPKYLRRVSEMGYGGNIVPGSELWGTQHQGSRGQIHQ